MGARNALDDVFKHQVKEPKQVPTCERCGVPGYRDAINGWVCSECGQVLGDIPKSSAHKP